MLEMFCTHSLGSNMSCLCRSGEMLAMPPLPPQKRGDDSETILV
jgi:hypothetical protein